MVNKWHKKLVRLQIQKYIVAAKLRLHQKIPKASAANPNPISQTTMIAAAICASANISTTHMSYHCCHMTYVQR
jgi:hypothetical protein